ncbi:unnamed protein product [Diamesa tonsa]
MVKGVERKLSLDEAKKNGKQKISRNKEQNLTVKDIYGNALSSINMVRGETGIIYDDSMAIHCCLWDQSYPECPERYISVMNRCRELKLIERCKELKPRMATKDEVLSKHTEEQYELLKSTKNSQKEDELEELSSHYDAIYIHPSTFDLSLLAVGSTIELVDNILDGNVQNGMAIIRPPGHHAMKAEFNGYCFFNNVAVAAQHALDNKGLNRILIVDWDVHHGQGTQRAFYDDPRVLYFSIHRFEQGTFWPNLRESDYDFIGSDCGEGKNMNVPLNRTGMTNADYMAIFQQLLLPVAIEFQPELIFISAGYDAAYGCPEGEMEITPACYAHLLSPLMALAQGRMAVVLEGGYCLESLAEGAALTLRALLGDPCPILEPLSAPTDSIQETILNCIYAHRPHWYNLCLQELYNVEELNNTNPQSNLHQVVHSFIGGAPVPKIFQTRDCYPIQSDTFKTRVEDRLRQLRFFTNLTFPVNRVCYVYDERMLKHKNLYESHPEQPDRISKIKERFSEYNIQHRIKEIPSRVATNEELLLVHSKEHVEAMTEIVKQDDLHAAAYRYNSVYLHPKTFESATVSTGSILQVVDEVLNGLSRSGVCVVRPPGHHAESDMPHGFCIFNNVAVAAKYAIENHGLKRVLIVDWDVHHGQGTQHIFEEDPRVLYISLHRYDNASFFPKSTDANYTEVGSGAGKGFNVNIPWNKKGMADAEYMVAFQSIILPIAYEFDPELVLVSAGFDASIGDPLGGCKVTPEAYGYFTHWLSSLANGKIILCLEGGYNVNSISHAMTLCTKALLGDPLPMLQMNSRFNGINPSCLETLRNVLNTQRDYWKCLKFNKKLPNYDVSDKNPDVILKQMETMAISSPEDADSGSSQNLSKTEDEPPSKDEPGTSRNIEKKQTLTDFLTENLEALNNEEMFAIVPLKSCPHLALLKPDEAPNSINHTSECEDCHTSIENWVCLHCFKTFCSRYINEHNYLHQVSSEHALTLSFSDLSVWCYKCEAYIDNPKLHKYKNLVHLSKFNEELVWSYESNEPLTFQLNLQSDDSE